MKTSWIERELADMYTGIGSEHREEKFHVCDMPNGFLRFIAKRSPNIAKGCLTDADVSIQNLKRGKTFKTIDIRQVNESIFSL